MKEKIYILGMIAFILAGCYDDKGNYDYKEVNDLLSITFMPEPVITEYSYNYEYRQPALDTLRVTYSPTITQSDAVDESNLEYQWIMAKTVNKETVYDTVRSKDILLKYPPKTSTKYEPLFRVIDHSTGIEYYRKFNMKTVIPFMNSWFVLHGQQGDRKLGVVEGVSEEGEELNIIYDVYEDIWGVRRFENATRLLYTMDGNDYRSGSYEHIVVIQPDSCCYMHAYDLVDKKGFELMMPNVVPRPRLAYGLSSVAPGTSSGLLVDQAGHFYWARGYGWYYSVVTNEDTEDYIVDKIFLPADGYVIVWDKIHKQFMYYAERNNPSNWGMSNERPIITDDQQAKLTLFEEGVFAEGEWEYQDVLYMGQGNSDMSERGVLVVARDTNESCTVYQMGFNNKGGSNFIEINKTPVPKMKLDADSQFATSVAFKEQIFYTRGSAVYLYNIVSGEEIYLYDAGGPITKLQFRMDRKYDEGYGTVDANKRLAIVVNNPDGTGELHDIFLDTAGDIERTLIHTGFGPIQDIIFSAPGIRHL